jgi:hypothetical protein
MLIKNYFYLKTMPVYNIFDRRLNIFNPQITATIEISYHDYNTYEVRKIVTDWTSIVIKQTEISILIFYVNQEWKKEKVTIYFNDYDADIDEYQYETIQLKNEKYELIKKNKLKF